MGKNSKYLPSSMSVIADWIVDFSDSWWISSPCFGAEGCFKMDFTCWVEAADVDDDENEDFCTDCCWKLEPEKTKKYLHYITL